MTGLFLIAVVLIWVIVAIWLARASGALVGNRVRRLVQVAVFAVLLPLPLIDEVIGGWQFRQLCKQHDTIQLDPITARGRTVYFAKDRPLEVPGTWTPVSQQAWRFLDATTDKPVLSYIKFTAEGGIFIRTLRISEGNAPLTFSNYCAPGGTVQYNNIFRALEIKLIDPRPALAGETK
jgi:hypothetical protein